MADSLCVCVCVLQLSADWERASLQPTSQPGGVFKSSPVVGAYTTEGFINSHLVSTEEESQEFDDLIFALKTGEDALHISTVSSQFSLIYVAMLFSFMYIYAASNCFLSFQLINTLAQSFFILFHLTVKTLFSDTCLSEIRDTMLCGTKLEPLSIFAESFLL